MQLPEDFWAFNFKLTNSHFYTLGIKDPEGFEKNQKIIISTKLNAGFTRQWRHCDVMLVLMLLQTVIEVVY